MVDEGRVAQKHAHEETSNEGGGVNSSCRQGSVYDVARQLPRGCGYGCPCAPSPVCSARSATATPSRSSCRTIRLFSGVVHRRPVADDSGPAGAVGCCCFRGFLMSASCEMFHDRSLISSCQRQYFSDHLHDAPTDHLFEHLEEIHDVVPTDRQILAAMFSKLDEPLQ